jgi:hypothetical protein
MGMAARLDAPGSRQLINPSSLTNTAPYANLWRWIWLRLPSIGLQRLRVLAIAGRCRPELGWLERLVMPHQNPFKS